MNPLLYPINLKLSARHHGAIFARPGGFIRKPLKEQITVLGGSLSLGIKQAKVQFAL
jgi:hypothetical protein